jgi:hypothetical protein
MISQFANQVMSSFLLFLDNKVGVKGVAYENVSTLFYLTTSPLSNYATYSAPYKQILADQSVGGRLLTGIYLNNIFIRTGTSGLYAINYDEGQLHFSNSIPTTSTISGNYSIKDFNFYITDQTDDEILFETKYSPRPKTTQQMSGLGDNQITYPCIFLNAVENYNSPYELGGTELTTIRVQATILSDSRYKLDAVKSILADTARIEVPLLNNNEYPFDSYGNYVSGIIYNYTGLVRNKIPTADSIFIDDVKVGRFNSSFLSEFRKINPCIYPGFAHFNLVKTRQPRLVVTPESITSNDWRYVYESVDVNYEWGSITGIVTENIDWGNI